MSDRCASRCRMSTHASSATPLRRPDPVVVDLMGHRTNRHQAHPMHPVAVVAGHPCRDPPGSSRALPDPRECLQRHRATRVAGGVTAGTRAGSLAPLQAPPPAMHMHWGRWRWARWRTAQACTASKAQQRKHGAHGRNGWARLHHVLISLVYGTRSARRVAERCVLRYQENLAGTFCTGVLCAGAAWHAVPGAYKREETSETTTNMRRASALRQRDPPPG